VSLLPTGTDGGPIAAAQLVRGQQLRTLDHISMAAKESQTGNEQHAFVRTPI